MVIGFFMDMLLLLNTYTNLCALKYKGGINGGNDDDHVLHMQCMRSSKCIKDDRCNKSFSFFVWFNCM